jgi:hypothetical protein
MWKALTLCSEPAADGRILALSALEIQNSKGEKSMTEEIEQVAEQAKSRMSLRIWWMPALAKAASGANDLGERLPAASRENCSSGIS